MGMISDQDESFSFATFIWEFTYLNCVHGRPWTNFVIFTLLYRFVIYNTVFYT